MVCSQCGELHKLVFKKLKVDILHKEYCCPNGHKVIIEKPVELEITGDKETDIYNNLKKFNSVIEIEIMTNPEEWWWVHNRWKRSYKYQETDALE